MEFHEILEYCQAQALANKFEPDAASVYRKFCRAYSKKFNTPLPEVMRLDTAHVLLTIFEDQLEDSDLDNIEQVEKLLDIIYSMEDPNYEGDKKKDLDDFVADAEAEEEQRLADGKTVVQSLKKKKSTPEKQEKPKELPKSGGINLSYLADKEENEG